MNFFNSPSVAQALLFSVSILVSFRIWPPVPLFSPGNEPLNVAQSLAAGRGFGNPYMAAQTGPTSHVSPAPVYGLALLYRLNPDLSRGGMLYGVLSLIVHAMIAPLLFRFAWQAGGGIWLAWMSGLLWCACPYRIDYEFESEWAALALLSFLLAVVEFCRRKGPARWSHGLALGGLMAFGLLINPLLLLTYIPALALLAWRWPEARVPQFCMAVAIPLLLGPGLWTLRNYVQFRQIQFVRGNFGLELWISNGDKAKFSLMANLLDGGFSDNHPNHSEKETQRIHEIGEAAYFREKGAAGWAWIQANPGPFRELTRLRIRALFLGDYFDPLLVRRLIFFSWLGLAPMAWLAWKRGQPHWVFALGILLSIAPYALIQYAPRYRVPYLPFLLCSIPLGLAFWRKAQPAPISLRSSLLPVGAVASWMFCGWLAAIAIPVSSAQSIKSDLLYLGEVTRTLRDGQTYFQLRNHYASQIGLASFQREPDHCVSAGIEKPINNAPYSAKYYRILQSSTAQRVRMLEDSITTSGDPEVMKAHWRLRLAGIKKAIKDSGDSIQEEENRMLAWRREHNWPPKPPCNDDFLFE